MKSAVLLAFVLYEGFDILAAGLKISSQFVNDICEWSYVDKCNHTSLFQEGSCSEDQFAQSFLPDLGREVRDNEIEGLFIAEPAGFVAHACAEDLDHLACRIELILPRIFSGYGNGKVVSIRKNNLHRATWHCAGDGDAESSGSAAKIEYANGAAVFMPQSTFLLFQGSEQAGTSHVETGAAEEIMGGVDRNACATERVFPNIQEPGMNAHVVRRGCR